MDVHVDDGARWCDMEHEVVKCGMCMVKEMNVLKRENELLRKEVGEMRLQNMQFLSLLLLGLCPCGVSVVMWSSLVCL